MNGVIENITEILRQLRTNALGPKNYYELYMKVFHQGYNHRL